MSNTIAFIGERKSGKDFFVEHLMDTNLNVKRLSFSDEVRHIACSIFDWLPFDFSPETKDLPFIHPSNPNNLTPRQIWLLVGQMRNIEGELFVRKFDMRYDLEDIQSGILGDKLHIITDFRTLQEYDLIKKHNIPIIKLQLADRSGIDPCSFEDYVRDFTDYDALFVNNKNGTAEFDVFFKEFICKHKIKLR